VDDREGAIAPCESAAAEEGAMLSDGGLTVEGVVAEVEAGWFAGALFAAVWADGVVDGEPHAATTTAQLPRATARRPVRASRIGGNR
jgi:hypothetical protein